MLKLLPATLIPNAVNQGPYGWQVPLKSPPPPGLAIKQAQTGYFTKKIIIAKLFNCMSFSDLEESKDWAPGGLREGVGGVCVTAPLWAEGDVPDSTKDLTLRATSRISG